MTAYWLVTVKYNPGTPQEYRVLDAETYRDAEDAVLRFIGYHPGVPISCKAMLGTPEVGSDPSCESCRDAASRVCTRHNEHGRPVLKWHPLTQAEKEMIRYND